MVTSLDASVPGREGELFPTVSFRLSFSAFSSNSSHTSRSSTLLHSKTDRKRTDFPAQYGKIRVKNRTQSDPIGPKNASACLAAIEQSQICCIGSGWREKSLMGYG